MKKKPRFGKIPKKTSTNTQSPMVPTVETLSAKDLLHRMKERNRLITPSSSSDTTSGSHFYEGQDLFQPDGGHQGFETNVDLLTDIRNFIAFQNSSAGEGETTTKALVEYFKEKLPPVKNPLFKALLNEICSYHKGTNHGIWRLKDEYR